jgi:hypothetical protein
MLPAKLLKTVRDRPYSFEAQSYTLSQRLSAADPKDGYLAFDVPAAVEPDTLLKLEGELEYWGYTVRTRRDPFIPGASILFIHW